MPRIKGIRLLAASAVIAVVAGCQPVAAPPAPVAPPVVYAPRAPTTPFGASANTIVPPLRVDGLRETVNRDIGPLETLWHVRSALNVAALSCTDPLYARIVDDYNSFIGKNARELRNANNAIISKFRREQGSGYKQAHDRHQTILYNYWSFSPLRRPFCDQAVQISQRATLVQPSELNDFAAAALPELEKPFTDFYLAYEEYERELDLWRQQYAPEQARDAADETINSTGLTEGPITPEGE